MDNRNFDDEEEEQRRENERALRKIAEEATRNISKILRSLNTRNNDSANRQERVEDDDEIQIIEQEVQIPTTPSNQQEINEAEASNNHVPVVSQVEGSNSALSQIATDDTDTVTAQAQSPPIQTLELEHATPPNVLTQSIQPIDQTSSNSTAASQEDSLSNLRKLVNKVDECDDEDIVVIHEVPGNTPATRRPNSTEQHFLRNTEDEYDMVPNILSAPLNQETLVPNTASTPLISQQHNQFHNNQNALVQNIEAAPLCQQQSQFVCNRNVQTQNTLLTSLSHQQSQLLYQNISVQNTATTEQYRQQQQNIPKQNVSVQNNTAATELYRQLHQNLPNQNLSVRNNIVATELYRQQQQNHHNQNAPVQNTAVTTLYRQQQQNQHSQTPLQNMAASALYRQQQQNHLINQNAQVQNTAATELYRQKQQNLPNLNVSAHTELYRQQQRNNQNAPVQHTAAATLYWQQQQNHPNQNAPVQNTAATALYQQQNNHNNAPVQNTEATALYRQQKHFLYNRLIANTTNNFSFPCNSNQNVPVHPPSTPIYHHPNQLFNQTQNVQLPSTSSTSQQQYHCPFPSNSNHNQNVPVRSIPTPTTPLYEQQPLVLSPYPSTSSNSGPSSNISTPITPTTTSPFSIMAQREALNHPEILREIEKYARRPPEEAQSGSLNALIEKIQPSLNGVSVDNIKGKLSGRIYKKRKKLMEERGQHQTNLTTGLLVTEERQQREQMQNQHHQQMPFKATENADIISRENEPVPVVTRSYSLSEEENLLNCHNLLPGWNEQIRNVNDIDKPADNGIFTERNCLEIGYEENDRIDGLAGLNMLDPHKRNESSTTYEERPPTLDLIDPDERQYEEDGGEDDAATSCLSDERPPTALYLDEQPSDEKDVDDVIEQKLILPTEKLSAENTIFNHLNEVLQLRKKITEMQPPILQTARRSTPFSCAVQTNLGMLRRFQKLPIFEPVPSPFSEIDPDWLKIKLDFQHVGLPEHFIKRELLEKIREKAHVEEEQQPCQVKPEARSEFDIDLPIEEGAQAVNDGQTQSSLEAIKEASIRRPPPLCKIPRMPKVRVFCKDIRKKSKIESIKKLRIATRSSERNLSRDSSSSSNTPQPSSNFLNHMPLRRNVSTSGTMNACKDVLSNKLANELFFNGSIRCEECHEKREWSRNAYPLHMLANHCIFIDINGPILDHLRTLCEKSFRAIVWRCVRCKKDFGKIHEFDQHCKSESHLSTKTQGRKKFTLDHVLSMCKEKNFMER